MFTQDIKHVFTTSNIRLAFDEISSNAKGLDNISYIEFKQNFTSQIKELIETILKGTYSPEPLKKIEIQKEDSLEKRPIALSSIKDKLVQRVLYKALNDYFDETFSNKSYAYRKDKSTLNAINKVSQFIQEQNNFILKTDIDNFFESINHDKLLTILDKHIQDKSIIRLISLFLQIGSFKEFDYFEHQDGVHQGDVLSPLLSNIYLDLMDKWLEKYDISFVRYADDFVVFSKKEDELKTIKENLEKFLEALDLKLGIDKTYFTTIQKGFSFLGVYFEGKNRIVENEKFQKSLSILHKISKKNYSFMQYTHKLNSYLEAIKNYYLKIIEKNSTQFALLQQHLVESISQKVYFSKSSKEIKTKKEFKIVLSKIKFDIVFELEEIEDKIELIIAKAYEHYLSNKSYKDTKTKIDKKKNIYAKKFANDSTLHINSFGLTLGISKNKFVVKEYGKVKQTYPFDKISRIILEGKGISISTDIIKKAVENNITIDFLNKDAISYASLITYKASTTQKIQKQSMVLNTTLHLYLAKSFIKGKAKNQINYLKYLNKYHKILDSNIKKMELTYKNIQKASTTNEVMGYEGSISVMYWDSIKLILEVPFEARVTFGAKDIVNSSLNYAYAILYGKVQHSLVYAGLSLNISFLHALDEQKPTLVYDMIEEFRTFVVDRTIFSMLNKNEPIKLDKNGLLNTKSKQLISKNIKEKLGSYTMWKKESVKVENIIQTQCYKLSKAIDEQSETYKPFIGKF
ncbi:CRISPR-associated endonuclease Cas1 [Aliarcobacter butzleri]|uniref:CRISPR-associated endonuclease Cas1 n=1 Tax=Aliarcobacter butzleri TaxID=28197 RepID=UPI00125F8CF5|nr:CRISPR-associated endonuclease Cas1 [Aliarcobacter butzleri]MCT7594413.1 CRISPR-associated endonuclease Cas1 [Aliarcobacter butzleri]MCT7599037.1 CRISPR-associated endonuclease Cas1 [Aliarcobacter butzleri]MCT7652880.1 CRISPR-associated endonuclease Cas1 [Aliarcobacter butzleri]